MNRRSSALFVVVASIAFAMSGPVARWARPAHPMAIACGRVAIAAIVLFLIDARGIVAAVSTTTRRQRFGIVIAGLLLAGHFALFLCGLERTSLPAAIALVSLEPLSVVLAAFFFHAIRPTRIEGIGVFTATLGAGVVALGAGTGDHRVEGDALVIAAVVLYGMYVAAARAYRGELTARTYASLVYAVAACALGAVLPFVRFDANGALFPLPIHSIIGIIILALVPTIVGHTAVQAAARTLSPSTVALVSPGETLGGIALGVAFLGAIPTTRELIGAVVVIAGATIAIVGGRPDKTAASP